MDSLFYFITMLHTVFYIALNITLLIKKNEHWHSKYLLLHLGFPFAKSQCASKHFFFCSICVLVSHYSSSCLFRWTSVTFLDITKKVSCSEVSFLSSFCWPIYKAFHPDSVCSCLMVVLFNYLKLLLLHPGIFPL